MPTPATPPQTPFEREQTTKRRGEISELAFALAAARQGFGIARPYGDSERYDIILDPSHPPSVIPTEAERKRAQSRACPEPAQGDLLLAPARPRLSASRSKPPHNSSTDSTALTPTAAFTEKPSPTLSPKSISSLPTSSPKIPGSSSR